MSKAASGIIQIDPSLAVPVYKQIVQSIIKGIEGGFLTKDDILPSVNKIAEEFSLARGSVFTAYNDLRASGIIDSIPGKGYYIASTETKRTKRIFVLFNSLSHYKEKLFYTLLNSLPATFIINVHFYNNNFKIFESQIRQHAGYYNYFIIAPPSKKDAHLILSQLDPKSIFLVETGFKEYKKDFAGVFQNFEKDIQSLLLSSTEALTKYKRLLLIAVEETYNQDTISGFKKFLKKSSVPALVKATIETEDIQKGDAYIVLDDKDLITIISHCKLQNWKTGKDIGIISYNESHLKSITGDGISTFSPDYEAMGKSLAEMILSRGKAVLENRYIITDRKSF